MASTHEKEPRLRAAGAEPVVANGLDGAAVMTAVMRSEPEVVIHEMTALAGMTSIRNFDKEFRATNRLRTEGTAHLLEASRAAGARRFVAQSFGNWNYERRGSRVKTRTIRSTPIHPKQRESLQAIGHLERTVVGADSLKGIGAALRDLYRPGTGISEDGEVAAMVRKRRFPIVGDGAGVWSFVHVDDAAAATIAAIERG